MPKNGGVLDLNSVASFSASEIFIFLGRPPHPKFPTKFPTKFPRKFPTVYR
jgi:hypothetical protein